MAPLECGSRRERIRSGRGLPLSGPTVCWRNDGITCEPQRRPPEATGVVLDEHTFHIEKVYREMPTEIYGILSGFRFFLGNFPTRLIDINRLHPKKRCFLQNKTILSYSDRTPRLSRTFPISWVLFYRMASYLSIVRHFVFHSLGRPSDVFFL